MPTTSSNQPPNKAIRVLKFLILGTMGAGFGYFGAQLLDIGGFIKALHPNGGGEKILFVAVFLFSLWLTIALHELGHLLAGLVQGFRIALYTAGLLGIRGTSRGFEFFFNKDTNLWGGLAATFPEKISSGPLLRRQFTWVVAAGPLSSLLVALVLGGMGLSWFHGLTPGASLAARLAILGLCSTGAFSVLIFVVTSLPLPSRGFMTDGARFLSLLKGGPTGEREEAGLAVMSLMGAGKTPAEYPANLLAQLTALPPDNFLGLNGHYTAFTHYLDRGDPELALPHAVLVEKNIDNVPAGPFKRYYLKELVFFYAFIARDADKATSLWAQIEKHSEKDQDSTTYRIKAALALLAAEPDNVRNFVAAGLNKLSALPFQGQRRFEEKWLKQVGAGNFNATASGSNQGVP